MFETVAPEIVVRKSRLLGFESLQASLALHAIVIACALALSWGAIQLPVAPPRLAFRFVALTLPAPPPPPPPPPAAAAPRAQQAPVRLTPVEDVAPRFIPETVPVLTPAAEAAPVTPAEPSSTAGVEGGVPGGKPGGVAGGNEGGVVGGTVGGVNAGRLGDDGRLHFDRDAPLPMYVDFQMLPEYPEKGRAMGWEDSLVVHYVIGKDGLVHDVYVMKKANRNEFEKPALEAISRWRFRPLTYAGRPVEVVHELTVYFRLE